MKIKPSTDPQYVSTLASEALNPTYVSNTLLGLANKSRNKNEFVRRLARAIKAWSGCQYIGIRILNEDNEIPFETNIGFNADFLDKENWLSTKHDYCLCTRVMTGNFNHHEKSALTSHGSFLHGDICQFFRNPSKQSAKIYRGHCLKAGFRSLAVIPFRYKNKPIGTIHLSDNSPHKINPSLVNLLETITPVIGDSLAKFRMEEQLRKNYDIQKTLATLLQLYQSNMDLKEMLQKALKIILSIPWFSFQSSGCIFLTDTEKKTLIMVASQGLEPSIQYKCSSVPFGKCLCGKAALKKEIIFANKITSTHEIHHKDTNPHGHYGVPIIIEDSVVGLINVYVKIGHRKRKIEIDFLTSIANTLAGIIRRKQMEQHILESNRALKALSACNRTLIHACDEKNLLKDVCNLIVKIGGYRLAWVAVPANGRDKPVKAAATSGISNAYIKKVKISWSARSPRGHGIIACTIRTKRMHLSRNFHQDNHLTPWEKIAIKLGYRSAIALPLLSNNQFYGALAIYSSQENAFDQDEIKLLTELADDLAFGIFTLRMRHAHELAEEKLLESYKHLGIINRQISILLDLNKKSGGSNTEEILNYIITSTLNLAQAEIVTLYRYDKTKENLVLMACSLPHKQNTAKTISLKKHPFLKTMVGSNIRIQGGSQRELKYRLCSGDKLRYFIFLPIIINREFKGSLFIGFTEKEALTTQELEFFEAFTNQASYVLGNLNIF